MPRTTPWSARLRDSIAWREASALIALAVLLRLPLLGAPLTYESDVWRQADTASIARHFYRGGYRLLYPQIYWGGAGPGYVESEFQLYPFLTALVYGPFGEHVWLGRLVSLVMTTLGCFAFAALAGRVVGPRPALFALGLYAFAPLSLRYSVAFMPEATVLCFFVLALLLYHLWAEHPSRSTLAAASVATGLALLVKPTSICVGPAALATLVEGQGWRVLRRPGPWLAAIGSLGGAALWFRHASSLYRTYGNTFGLLSGGDSKLGDPRQLLSPSFYVALARLDWLWVLPGFAALIAMAGAAQAVRQRKALVAWVGAVTVGLYYMAVARYARETWGIQYHVYALPFAALFFGLGCDWLSRGRGRLALGLAIVSSLAGPGLVYHGLLRPPPNREVECGKQVGRVVPPEALIVVTSSSAARDNNIPNNFEDPVVFFYADRHGWSLPVDGYDPRRVDAYRAAGARFLVVTDPSLLAGAKALRSYLGGEARSVDAGAGTACAVFELGRSGG